MQDQHNASAPSAEDAALASSRISSRRRGLQLYFALLSLQTVGVAILLVNMIPLYRMMVLNFAR